MNNFLAIDFGSTSCRTAYITTGPHMTPVIVPNRYSEGKLPALIQFTDKRDLSHEMGTLGTGLPWSFSSIKQKIGFEETFSIGNRKRKVINMATDIFRAIKEDAERHTDEVFQGAVITVPSCFPEKQRAAIKSSAEESGFNTVRLLDESLAAVLACKEKQNNKGVLVYALGGGIFTASVYRVNNGLPQPLWHEGDRELGGNKFDELIVRYLINECNHLSETEVFMSNNINKQKVKNTAERIKIGLSESDSVTSYINSKFFISPTSNNHDSLEIALSRSEFEAMIREYIENTLSHTKKALQQSEIGIKDIGTILLVGGSTKIPLVERMVKEEIGKDIITLSDNDIAIGAAIYIKQFPSLMKQTKVVHDKDGGCLMKTKTVQAKETVWLQDCSSALAQSFWQNGEHDKAIDTLDNLLKELPCFIANLCYQKGKVLLDTNNIDEAMYYLEKALSHNSKDKYMKNAFHQACNKKGRMLEGDGKYPEARSMIRMGLKYNPKCEGCGKLLERIETALKKQGYSGMRNSVGSRKKKKRK